MEKRNFKNKKLMTGILASSLLLGSACTACSSKNKTFETVIVYETVVVTATPEPTKVPTNTPIPTNTPSPTPTNIPTPTNTPTPTDEPRDKSTPPTEYHSADSGIDAFWDDVYNKINYINWKIDNIDYDDVKETTINYAKDLIDFIFYGGEMNGTTFDELKDDAKQEIYAKLQQIDEFIMGYMPDYKERLGEKYNLVKDFASTSLEKAKEVFNSHIDIDINIEKQNIKQKKLIMKK